MVVCTFSNNRPMRAGAFTETFREMTTKTFVRTAHPAVAIFVLPKIYVYPIYGICRLVTNNWLATQNQNTSRMGFDSAD